MHQVHFDQFLSGELHDRLAVGGRGNEGIVFLRRNTGHGLKPVGKMSRPFFNGPVHHGDGDDIRHGGVEIETFVNGLSQRFVSRFGQVFLHDGIAEHVGTENLV